MPVHNGLSMKQFSDDKDYHDMFDDIFHKWNVTTFFQPVIDVKANKLYGIDASAWLQSKKHSDVDFIPPGDFLNAAEKNGETINITKNILLQIQEYVSGNDVAQYKNLRFFLSISRHHLFRENIMVFAEDCIQTARRLKDSDNKLVIEVNSRISFDSIHKLKLLYALLSVQGNIDFALADFGAGHSNIQMLFGFDFNYIKIDQHMFFPSTSKVITHGFADDLMSGLRKQNTDIIITGVNTEKHLRYFLNKHVHFFQGDYFNKAVAYNKFSVPDYFGNG